MRGVINRFAGHNGFVHQLHSFEYVCGVFINVIDCASLCNRLRFSSNQPSGWAPLKAEQRLTSVCKLFFCRLLSYSSAAFALKATRQGFLMQKNKGRIEQIDWNDPTVR